MGVCYPVVCVPILEEHDTVLSVEVRSYHLHLLTHSMLKFSLQDCA